VTPDAPDRLLHHLAAARARLIAAGIPAEEAEIDARLLAQETLEWDAARLLASRDQQAPAGFAIRYGALVARRAAREPMAYILGRQEFWDLSVLVEPSVLIPRPESEHLVEAALELSGDHHGRAADVCTGSGCLALALARERPRLTIVATDISAEGLAVARRNAARHGLADRIAFVRTDLLAGLAGPFDLVLSNPPYVPRREREALPPEVGLYEPPLALFAGDDGLDAIRALVATAPDALRPGGALVFEFGFGQAEAVAGLIAGSRRLRMVAIRPDLQGIPRAAVARRVEHA
jgi:release factor glutamine methyltransferase